jgi:hypothetical protein
MKYCIIIVSMLSAKIVSAGGFEASRLDTNFIYEEGNYAELSYGSLDYDVRADTRALTAHRLNENSVKTSQTRNTGSFKASYGGLDIGLTKFKSGTIQLAGNASLYATNHPDCTTGAQAQCALAGPVPETDVDLNTLGLIGKLSVSNEFDVLFGLKRNRVENSTVTTTRGTFTLSGSSNTVGMAGFAYSKPEIALRVELLMQPSSSISAATSFVASQYAKDLILNAGNAAPDPAPGCTTADHTASLNTTMSTPQMMTLNFKSGVAKDTLVYGSIHRVDWSSAQINAETGCVATRAASAFWDTTTYTIGAARKLSDSLALTASFVAETGGSDTTASLFTVNNGYNAINLGARYTVGKVTISGGYNYTKLGDVTVLADPVNPTREHARYRNNNVSALGLKVGISF